MPLLACAVWAFAGVAFAQVQPPGTPQAVPTPPPTQAPKQADNEHQGPETDDQWLDRTQQGVYDMVWKSAMHVDRWFGSDHPPSDYQGASGSLTPSLLWTQFDGLQPKLRFRVDVPLPQLNDRFHAFVGRVDRDEYISESVPDSGALPRTYGPVDQEQTLAGISYRTPSKQGSRFDFGTGIRLQFPLDPYVKASYVYERGDSMSGLFSLRETAFWQNTQKAGVTTRMDLEKLFLRDLWLLRWTTSASFSERSQGIYGYSAISALRGLPNRRAIALEAGIDGMSDYVVPVHEYGVKAAYRQAIVRDWLVMEVRTSLTWPREKIEQERSASWGVGIGFEMFFGTNEFLARPITF
ncbi:MAG: hypothetical protein WDO68_11475 [Gammaproteobacteria bacterium]